jgi:hypothetical protein
MTMMEISHAVKMLNYYQQQQPLRLLQLQKTNLDASTDKLMNEIMMADNKLVAVSFRHRDLNMIILLKLKKKTLR